MSKSRLFNSDLDYHLVRASMVLIYLLFGYQKWWEYEAQTLIPFISNGPLIFWMYPVFGVRGASWFLGVSGCGSAGSVLLFAEARCGAGVRCRGRTGPVEGGWRVRRLCPREVVAK